MCFDILINEANYEVLSKDPTFEYVEELRRILKGALDRGILSKDEYIFIINNDPYMFKYTILTAY